MPGVPRIQDLDGEEARPFTDGFRAPGASPRLAGTIPGPTIFRTVGDVEMRKSAALSAQPDEVPTTETGTVIKFPKRRRTGPSEPDRANRREWLTEREVDQLCDAARKRGRYGHRDDCAAGDP